jgi:nicotinamidase/pyrazinamidase
MKPASCLFWNVDTQYDFVSPKGKLYVPDAEMLLTVWQQLTQLAEENSIKVVNSADWHFDKSNELSENPDFVNSFPPHCMANTLGAKFVNETNPENPLVFDWDKEIAVDTLKNQIKKHRNIVIRKDAFDVFRGNPYTEKILDVISPKTVVVYGVTTNVCVNDAVLGLASRVKRVIVVKDAIKELPNIPLPFEKWMKLGVELKWHYEIERMF